MIGQATAGPQAHAAGTAVRRLGFWAALLTAVVTALAFGLAITTLPVSGPFCAGGCVAYPYHEVASRVPHDYIWMYPAILLLGLFAVLIACIHQAAAESQRLYSLIGLLFAAMAAAVLAVDYYIQIATLQPSIVKGEVEGLALITQYNPHGIFIALEELGYLLMSLAFLFCGFVFSGTARLDRTIRWLLIGGAAAAFVAYGALSLIYGRDLEYRFEVAVITINWTVLIVVGMLLSVWFRRKS